MIARTRAQARPAPVRVGVVGLTHDHVHQVLQYPAGGAIELVGIAEPNRELAMRYLGRYRLPDALWFASAEDMLDAAKPEAVCAFNSIVEHRAVVELAAPRGIHVMVEKPLAVDPGHAQAIASLARQHKIHVLTNFETTWYASHHRAYDLVHHENAIGEIRKVVVHDGHLGPREIGCSPEFVQWLTDPTSSGGGAVIDFGCYGAGLMTWLMQGQRPASVTAVLQQLKPEVYPQVDDEATIVLTYPRAQAIVQASWNWPFDRKDIEIYGQTGSIFATRHPAMRLRRSSSDSKTIRAPKLPADRADPFAYLAAVVRGTVPSEDDLSSLQINLIVAEILEAALRSAKTRTTIELPASR